MDFIKIIVIFGGIFFVLGIFIDFLGNDGDNLIRIIKAIRGK